ncbi:MAG: UvrD-helicase domain-containing protein [Candidatus Nitronauta litoralis]|uniref:DNA 3'-5' helicase n=1 Tax=Candidatus Nitronauta litoralis TaxID=2705533 RepID=A0A7T0BUG0_9BACT|nr:MAG: UvrD-helicase domain-containing protein [Candidatus Nitronauta litoralis]
MALSDELNPRQLEAVTTTEGPLLVVAGAGSGKTRAITYRILHLIRDKQVSPENILAITFTNKAAREMRERVFQQLDSNEAAPWVSTFHSLCLKLLRRHISELGYSNEFVIFDAQDQLALIKKCMKEGQVNSEAFPPKSLLGKISEFKNDFKMPEELDPETFSYGPALKAVQIYPRYQKALKEHNALDFDDLLVLTVRLLRQSDQIREYYNERFKYLLVDEFQDTNLTQYRLIQLLSQRYHNVCVVGDDDQSIYSWRGARIENILRFEREFEGARVIKLEQNYRSTQTILKVAGAVVRENENRKDKTLWTENEEGEPVIYFRAEDEVDEARIAAERLNQWNQEDGISFDDAAVLYRTNAQSRAMEDHLRHLGMPYRVVGGQKFYERKEIKDVLAYMKVILNPADSVSLKRILNVPTRGIGKTSVEKVEDWCQQNNATLAQGLREATQGGLVGSGPGRKIEQFLNLLDQLSRVYQDGSALDFLQDTMEKSGYLAMLEKENTIESRGRVENLNELYNAVEAFVETERRGTLLDFLDSATLVSDQDLIDESRGVIHLMTLHTCKGLEFDAVVILGVENGLLPHTSSMSDNTSYEEERRLCYVGLTRARKKLMVTNTRHRRMHGSTFHYQPSDFLLAIPPELLQKEMSEQRAPLHDRYGGKSQWQDNRAGRQDEVPAMKSSGGKQASGEFAVGTRVLHPKFGQGVVVMKEGEEEDLRVTVFFKSEGKKKLVARKAKLIML